MRIEKTVHSGPFLRSCPCSPGRQNCSYYVLSPAMGCPFDCSYCFLNFYMSERKIIIHSNIDDMFCELSKFLDSNKDNLIRIGTGEFMDSMALAELDDINSSLVQALRSYPNTVMEFKTKSARIGPFLKRPGSKNIILSWSLNPESIIRTEELGTASLKQRIEAAKEAQKNGYSLAFHFDPIFMSKDLLSEYIDLVDMIFKEIDPNAVKWFSMGGFRYTEDLKYSILKRYMGKKWYLGEEYVRCSDGKYRFPKTTRINFYSILGNRIKKFGDIKTYMCMEEGTIWDKIPWGKSSILRNLHPSSS